MATLTGQSIASSYEQLLHVDTDGGGNTTTLVPIKDGDNGTTFCLQLSTTKAMIEGSGSKLFFSDEGGEYISGDGTDLTITSGADIILSPTGHVGIGTTGRLMSGYDANSTTLTVYDGSGSAQSGYLELGGTATTNGYNAGVIAFINNNNADATNFDADSKMVAMIRSEIATTDNNAGDDSGSGLTFWTKPEAGSLATRIGISSTGDVTVSTGNLVIGTAGKGIDFSNQASPAAGMTSELLDHYEEGVIVPTLTCGSGTVTAKSGEDTLGYTKIGNRVFLTGKIELNSVSSPSGSFTIALPFAVGDVSDFGERFGQVLAPGDLGTAVDGVCTVEANAGESVMAMVDITSTGGIVNMADHFQANSFFRICLNYISA